MSLRCTKFAICYIFQFTPSSCDSLVADFDIEFAGSRLSTLLNVLARLFKKPLLRFANAQVVNNISEFAKKTQCIEIK